MHGYTKTVASSKRVIVKEKEKEKERVASKPPDSAGQVEAEDSERPWTHHVARPEWADPPKDSSFTIEDDGLVAAMDSTMSCFTVVEPLQEDNPVVFVSAGFEKMSGYPSEELLGEPFNFLQRNKKEHDALVSMREAMSTRRPLSVEVTNSRKDGRKFRAMVCLLPVLDASGNLLKYLCVQTDLDSNPGTGSKFVEQVTTYIKAFVTTDNTHDGAPIWTANEAFPALTGYTQAEIRGFSVLSLFGPDSGRGLLKKVLSGHWNDKPTSSRMTCYKKDGTPFCAYLWSCPLWERGQSPCKRHLVITVDITTTKLRRMGKYTLGRVIGQGASGIVYKGMNTTNDEVVAVKSVDASRFRSISEIEQMQEEMNVSASLKHPNIIRLYEVHFNNNVFYLVMELSSGGSLMKYIHDQSSNCLDEAETRRLFIQMVSALDYCHRRRIIHRDLKPENILMDKDNNVKIADFGLAAVSGFSAGLTLQCGTPEFTAPEITTGKEYEGASIDIWSLGVILYEMLTGKLPFQGANTALLFKAIQKGVYEPLPAPISDHCKDLLSTMLNVNPTHRSTMDDIIRHPWLRGDVGRGDDAEAKDGVERCDSASSEDLSSPRESTPRGPSFDVTPSAINDSVRVVIPGMADKDDPIMLAMMRSQGIFPSDDNDSGSPKSSPHGPRNGLADKAGALVGMNGRGGQMRTGIPGHKVDTTPTRNMRGDLTDSRAMRGVRPDASSMRTMSKNVTSLRKQPLPPLATITSPGHGDRRPTHEVAKDMMNRVGRYVNPVTSPTDIKDRERRGLNDHATGALAHRNLPPLSRR